MKLVINGKFAAQRLTGVQRVAHELTRALARPGHAANRDAPVVMVPSNAANLEPAAAAAPPARWQVVGRLRGNLWEQLSLPLAVRARLLVSLCNTGPLFKRRHVVMIHDMAIYDVPHAFTRKFRLWYRLVFFLLARNAQQVLTVSAFSRDRIVARLGVAASRVSVVRPAAGHLQRIDSDLSVLARLGLQRQQYCLMVGSLDPRKNLARCLEAIETVDCPPHFRFVLVGAGNARIFSGAAAHPARPDSHKLVRSGYVTDAELKALYENATCFVFPSLYEGFGLPPLEAMYCGCPVIVSRESSLPEACGDAALYCDAYCSADIAGKIAQLIHDPALRAHYRQLGLAHAHGHDWNDAARQFSSALATLTGRTSWPT